MEGRGRAQRNFKAEKIYFTIMMSTYSIIHLFQPTECTRVNYNINYGFWVIGMYHCRFINYNKYTTLVERMLIIGEATHVCGQGVYGKSLPFSQICSEPETALKKCKVLGVILFLFFFLKKQVLETGCATM